MKKIKSEFNQMFFIGGKWIKLPVKGWILPNTKYGKMIATKGEALTWTISEWLTGAKVGGDHNTIKESLQDAIKRIDRNRDRFEETKQLFIKTHGICNEVTA